MASLKSQELHLELLKEKKNTIDFEIQKLEKTIEIKKKNLQERKVLTNSGIKESSNFN